MNARKRYLESDLDKLDSIKDDEIDYSDIPELDEKYLVEVELGSEDSQDEVLLKVDHEVLEFFKNQSKNYQVSMSHVLKAYVAASRHKK